MREYRHYSPNAQILVGNFQEKVSKLPTWPARFSRSSKPSPPGGQRFYVCKSLPHRVSAFFSFVKMFPTQPGRFSQKFPPSRSFGCVGKQKFPSGRRAGASETFVSEVLLLGRFGNFCRWKNSYIFPFKTLFIAFSFSSISLFFCFST